MEAGWLGGKVVDPLEGPSGEGLDGAHGGTVLVATIEKERMAMEGSSSNFGKINALWIGLPLSVSWRGQLWWRTPDLRL